MHKTLMFAAMGILVGSVVAAQVVVRPRSLGDSLGVMSELAEPMYQLAKQAFEAGRLPQSKMTQIDGYYYAWKSSMQRAKDAKSHEERERCNWIAAAALGQMLKLIDGE